MKKLIFLFLCVIGVMAKVNAHQNALSRTVAPMAQQQEDPFEHLIVWHKDGSIVSFRLAEKPKITYSGEKAIIQTSTVIEYDFQEIRKISFEKDIPVPTGISDRSLKPEKPFKSDGETITFFPGDQDLNVRIVSTNGILMKQMVVRKGEQATLSLNSFPTNIYMINVNGVTYKIHVR